MALLKYITYIRAPRRPKLELGYNFPTYPDIQSYNHNTSGRCPSLYIIQQQRSHFKLI